MRLVLRFFVTAACLLAITAGITVQQKSAAVERVEAYVTEQSHGFAAAARQLHAAIAAMNGSRASVVQAQQALYNCRLHYQRIGFFLQYFFSSAASEFDMPAKYEIEEPYMEYQHPVGMQVIEAGLFDKKPLAQKQDLLQQAALIEQSAADLPSLLYQFTATDAQLLESIRLEVIRIMTLHITGYNAPLLKSGVAEAREALSALQYTLQPYLEAQPAGKTAACIGSALQYLQQHADFDSFNRLVFLRSYALPLQQQIGLLAGSLHTHIQTATVLNYDAAGLFSNNAFRMQAFPGGADSVTETLVRLGKQLFYDTRLSGNNSRSCATCHQPDKYFTDALPQSKPMSARYHISRNAPTLLYGSYQFAFFWEGRAASPVQQIAAVVTNAAEMQGDTSQVVRVLQCDTVYRHAFANVFSQTKQCFSFQQIAEAITAYLQSLHPFTSPYDRFMQGDTAALTALQQTGGNLFMGKAQCGTCHFTPLFNGLTPPYYNRTEFEVLGVPQNNTAAQLHIDKDSGRYKVLPIPFYLHAFKTPTVRNSAVTAPYMHNGVYKTLDEVMDFYNAGGGAGKGIVVSNQTLGTTTLQLTVGEQKAVIAFLQSLTDIQPTR
ncbi:cytochrome-c peroxidase [Deminuibacter soli]|uniref:Cytochrome C peroxidase n=1 Tax=Deminuibacter soli TaxID=2291815 RepID=A0A3E1NCN8_9BACT|nr:cytochrome c peroxidase [Deminuibacter soli]RFM25723.1 cytochrome C peroxidase [Deminuibacter soli]